MFMLFLFSIPITPPVTMGGFVFFILHLSTFSFREIVEPIADDSFMI